MTEEEALNRVDSIGQAFANDYNDGDGPDYDGVDVYCNEDGDLILRYTWSIIDDDGDEIDGGSMKWRMERAD